jgi:hypothetical protein
MNMLLYKAWLETRVRFLAGLAGVAIICIYNVGLHDHLVSMWLAFDLQHQLLSYPRRWLETHDYGWYLWHILYDEALQQTWALFAVVLAFGGLIREKTSGTVSFSLGLPISRRRWLFTRLAAVGIESVALSLFAVLVLIISSAVIHQTLLPLAGASAYRPDGGRWRLHDRLWQSLLRLVPRQLSKLALHRHPSRSSLPVDSAVRESYAGLRGILCGAFVRQTIGTRVMVDIFEVPGYLARHGRPVATQLGDHPLDIAAGDMDAHFPRTRINRSLW